MANFLNNTQLTQEANSFNQYLSNRSPFDQQFLSFYDPLSISAQTIPNSNPTQEYFSSRGGRGRRSGRWSRR